MSNLKFYIYFILYTDFLEYACLFPLFNLKIKIQVTLFLFKHHFFFFAVLLDALKPLGILTLAYFSC